ncbi:MULTISPECIES: hypothetical protein [Sphingomonas]|uniref:hypothetical protein n=1 Tax=Sphingomonas TaxID=13687 RepID=UPI000B1FD28E|nr:hypothetical protein [Sphingomonas sp. CCH10-B3]
MSGLILVAALWANGQTMPPAPPQPVVTPIETAAVTGQTVTLKRDTPIELMAMTEVSTASAKPGQVFKLRVNKPVVVSGVTVVPAGSWVYGEIIAARDAGGLGKSGRLTAKLTHLALGDVRIPVEGDISAKGTGAGSAGAAVLFAGLTGLFHRGNNAKIKGGEIVNGFIADDVTLDLSGPSPRLVAPAAAPAQ